MTARRVLSEAELDLLYLSLAGGTLAGPLEIDSIADFQAGQILFYQTIYENGEPVIEYARRYAFALA